MGKPSAEKKRRRETRRNKAAARQEADRWDGIETSVSVTRVTPENQAEVVRKMTGAYPPPE